MSLRGASRPLVFLSVGLLMAGLGFGTAVLAEDPPLVANRPGFSNVWEIVDVGDVELNSGIQLTRTGEDEAVSFGQVLIRTGLSERLELRVGLSSFVELDSPSGDVSGFEDPLVGLKLELSGGSGTAGWGRPATSLIVQATLPEGSTELGAPEVQPGAILVMAWDPAPGIHLDSNVGVSRLATADGRIGELSTSHALGLSLAGNLALYLEYAGAFPLEGQADDAHFLFGALTYLPSSRTQLDIGMGRGLNGVDPDYFVSAGVARRW